MHEERIKAKHTFFFVNSNFPNINSQLVVVENLLYSSFECRIVGVATLTHIPDNPFGTQSFSVDSCTQQMHRYSDIRQWNSNNNSKKEFENSFGSRWFKLTLLCIRSRWIIKLLANKQLGIWLKKIGRLEHFTLIIRTNGLCSWRISFEESVKTDFIIASSGLVTWICQRFPLAVVLWCFASYKHAFEEWSVCNDAQFKFRFNKQVWKRVERCNQYTKWFILNIFWTFSLLAYTILKINSSGVREGSESLLKLSTYVWIENDKLTTFRLGLVS